MHSRRLKPLDSHISEQQPAGDEERLHVPKAELWGSFRDVSEFRQRYKRFPGSYWQPKSLTFPTIDAVYFAAATGRLLLLQYTVSAAHTVSDAVLPLLQVLAPFVAASGLKPWLVFAVPLAMAPTWTRCQAVSEGDSTEAASAEAVQMLNDLRREQWLLELPIDVPLPGSFSLPGDATPGTAQPPVVRADAAASVSSASLPAALPCKRRKRGPVRGSKNTKTCNYCTENKLNNAHHWKQCALRPVGWQPAAAKKAGSKVVD